MSNLIPNDPLGNLGKLKERHLAILGRLCAGMSYKEISQDMHLAVGTVKTYMGQVYIILNLNYLSPAQRRKVLLQDICPALESGDFHPASDEEYIALPEITPDIEGMIEEDEKALILRGPDVIDLVPYSAKRSSSGCSRSLLFLIIGLLLGAALIYVVLTQILPPRTETVFQTSEPVVTEVLVYQNQEVTRIITATPEPQEPTSAPIVEQVTVVVTATPIPPTNTPEIPPIQPPGFVFFDDFEDGPDPLWETKYGELGMANGKFTITTPFSNQRTDHLTVLSNNYWSNVSVSFDLDSFEGAGVWTGDYAYAAILVNYQENGNSIGLYISGTSVEFGYLDALGEWHIQSGSKITSGEPPGFDLAKGPNEIKIERKGDTYFAFINSKPVTSATIPGSQYGQIAIWMSSGTFSDAVEKQSARIEYISIESLP